MSDAVVDDIVALLPPLLRSLDTLGLVARHLHPPDFDRVMAAVGEPEQALQIARSALSEWPARFSDIRASLEAASEASLAAFAGLRSALGGRGDLATVLRALRHVPQAQEALYPLAARLAPVNSFFVDPALRDDADLLARLAEPAAPRTGVFHHRNEPGSRGGYSLYVPEYYTQIRAWPLVVALHGGSGDGRRFLWSWLRDARSFGALLLAPTATGSTWALMGEDNDTPNIMRCLEIVRGQWNVDPRRLLLTGMSDGGTFCYVSGLTRGSPFTHLAPIAATFHPVLVAIADAGRLRGLPLYLVHGSLDWMFPAQQALLARDALSLAGANVTYREIEDLSHCYPREANAQILRWLNDGA